MGQDADSEKSLPAGQEEGPPPEEPVEAGQPEYEIDIFKDWCKGCGICAAFCPRQCLSLDAEGFPVVAKGERCTGCRWCELHCPDFAICVKELKAREEAKEAGD